MTEASNMPSTQQAPQCPFSFILFWVCISGFSSSFLHISALWWGPLSERLIKHLAYTPMYWHISFKLIGCLSNQHLAQCFAHHALLPSTCWHGDLIENMWLIAFGWDKLPFGEGTCRVRQIWFEFWLGRWPSLGTCLISQIKKTYTKTP